MKSLIPGVGEYDLLSENSVDSKGVKIPRAKRVTITDEIANRKLPGVGEYNILSDSFTMEGKKILTRIARAPRITITDEYANRKIPGSPDYSPLRPQKTLGGTIAAAKGCYTTAIERLAASIPGTAHYKTIDCDSIMLKSPRYSMSKAIRWKDMQRDSSN